MMTIFVWTKLVVINYNFEFPLGCQTVVKYSLIIRTQSEIFSHEPKYTVPYFFQFFGEKFCFLIMHYPLEVIESTITYSSFCTTQILDLANKMGPALQVGEKLVWKKEQKDPSSSSSNNSKDTSSSKQPQGVPSIEQAIAAAPAPPVNDPDLNKRRDRTAVPAE